MLKNITPSLAVHGGIRAGTKGEEVISKQGNKFRLPQKLDHYIITTTERDLKTDLLVLEKDLMDKLKDDKSLVDKKGDLTTIPIRLLYNDVDLNFNAWNACYVKGKCVCSGNGETAKTRDNRDIKCPCDKINYDYQGKDKCKVNGKLYVIIDGIETVGACYVLRTTSKNTVKSILGGLSFLKASTGGILAFLPLHLVLKPLTVETPVGIQTIYISSIIFRGTIQDLQTKSLEMAKSKAKYLIAMDSVEDKARYALSKTTESPQEEKDVQQEFYPDNENIQDAEIQPDVEQPEVEKAETGGVTVPRDKKVEPEKTKLDIAKESIEKDKKEPETSSETVDENQDVDQTDNTDETDNKQDESEQVDIGRQTPDIQMISKDQKHQVVKLKKEKKIQTGAPWDKVLKPFNVKTANDLTFDQAEKFIESLNENPT